MDRFISIKETATLFGETTTTIRRWETSGHLIPNHRTFGNHRRYSLKVVLDLLNPNTIIIYFIINIAITILVY